MPAWPVLPVWALTAHARCSASGTASRMLKLAAGVKFFQMQFGDVEMIDTVHDRRFN